MNEIQIVVTALIVFVIVPLLITVIVIKVFK